jgi:hypothetical protein
MTAKKTKGRFALGAFVVPGSWRMPPNGANKKAGDLSPRPGSFQSRGAFAPSGACP